MSPRAHPVEQVHVEYVCNAARKILCLMEHDREVATELTTQLDHFGYRVRTFARPDDLEAVDDSSVAAILMDVLELPPLARAGVPAIFISARDDLPVRLAAARAGFSACVSKPIDLHALVSTLDRLIPTQRPEPDRVLIVDSSRQWAEHYASTLTATGIQTEVITDPHDILNGLAAFQPDLVLMDMFLPGCTGAEVASVIRQIETYVLVPVLFLSTEQEANRQLAATRLGGVEFLIKPVGDDNLVSAVSSRLQRYRVLRSYVVRDSLTGVLNHAATMDRLDLEISRAAREHRVLCFAMIDMDHFKEINDTYGHPAGDRVLKSLTHLLKQRLRKTDVIGRLGGEEFGVILPYVSLVSAMRLMDELREAFSSVRQHTELDEFTATFSCGVAELQPGETADAIVATADRALYRAKQIGRNRILARNPS